MKKTTIILADDHNIFRFGVSQILEKEENFQILGETGSGEAAYEMTQKLQPDLILMDITFPHKNGVDLTHKISQNLNTKVLILTSCEEDSCIVECLRAGAAGYLVKNVKPAELVRAIKTIATGHNYFSKNLSNTIFENSKKEKLLFSQLDRFSITSREFEVLKKVSNEKSNKEIAEELLISHRTVETHKRNLMLKLKMKNVVGLVKFYFQLTHFEISKTSNF